MSNLTFNFNQNPVRVVGDEQKPFFVAKDIAKALGHRDTINAIKRHCKYQRSIKEWVRGTAKGVAFHHPLELDPQTVLIPESDVYRLVFGSKLPAAERFTDWVVDEVLPAIRQQGHYTLTITPAQKAQIRDLVRQVREQTGASYSSIYWRITQFAKVSQYAEIPAKDFDAVVGFISQTLLPARSVKMVSIPEDELAVIIGNLKRLSEAVEITLHASQKAYGTTLGTLDYVSEGLREAPHAVKLFYDMQPRLEKAKA